MNENRPSTRRYWILGGVSLLVATIAFAFFTLGTPDDVAAQDQRGETATVFLGDLTEKASVSGQVQAKNKAALSFNRSGTVDAVFVDVGDTVTAGQPLAQLGSANLENNVASAQQDVIIAEAELNALFAAPTGAELTSAEAAVASAQANLTNLLAPPSEAEIAAELARVDAAQANLWAAAERRDGTLQTGSEADILSAEANLADAEAAYQAAHDAWVRAADCEEDGQGGYICTTDDSDRSVAANLNLEAAAANLAAAQATLDSLTSVDDDNVNSAQASVQSSQAAYEAALANYDAFSAGPTENEIAAAEATVASAEAALDRLLREPAASTIKIYETRLAQAETNLRAAEDALADATLTAPFAGIVTTVNVAPGETAGGIAFTIVDTASYEVIVNVDEVDISTVTIGQPAALSFESWPGGKVMAEVTAIAPAASTDGGGIVSYQVHLSLGETEITIREGMTADADLVTAAREDVLLVDNAAIRADRRNNQYFVTVASRTATGETEYVEIEVVIGLNDKEFTQIISGLEVGDEVLLGQLVATSDDSIFPPSR